MTEFLFSEQIAIARFAHTGKWIAKRLPKAVLEMGIAERAKHKRGERCFGCDMQAFDVVITIGGE